MAGLDPATQRSNQIFRRADARRAGGRVKPGYGEMKKIQQSRAHYSAFTSKALIVP